MMTEMKIHGKLDGTTFKPNATSQSIELVKKLYHAMKHENIFYKFQRRYFPLRGLDRYEEAQAIIGQRHFLPDERCYNLDKFIYIPSNKPDNIPSLLAELLYIKRMLMNYYDYSNYSILDRVEEDVVLDETIIKAYLRCYYFKNLKNKKIILTDLGFEIIFGIIGSVLTFLLLFYLTSIVMPTGFVACFSVIILIFSSVSLMFLKNKSEI